MANTTEAKATTDTAEATNGSANQRPRPTYKAVKVDELPPKLAADRSGPRTSPALIEAFQVAHSDPGGLYELGTFQSPNGARTLLKRIHKGDVKGVPTGDWDFEVRQIEAPDGTGKRWSKLFGKFMG